MRVLLQRVSRGRVAVVQDTGAEENIAEIDRGFVLLVGVGHGDTEREAEWLARKVAGLRVFEDAQGKMNLSLLDLGGEALVVSQFTLLANTQKGRRPSFVQAADPDVAEPLVEKFAAFLDLEGVPVRMGKFGTHMLVSIENDGPVTIMLERLPG